MCHFDSKPPSLDGLAREGLFGTRESFHAAVAGTSEPAGHLRRESLRLMAGKNSCRMLIGTLSPSCSLPLVNV